MHAQPPACLESTQSVHRVLKALKNVLRVTLSLYKLSLTLIIKKLKMPKSTQFGPKNTVIYGLYYFDNDEKIDNEQIEVEDTNNYYGT